MEMGFFIAAPLIVFLLAGLWLDKKFQTIPLFTIIFIVISLVSVVVELRYIILPLLEKRSQKK
jgi:F0F1-type ATP synthase assembly protein I